MQSLYYCLIILIYCSWKGDYVSVQYMMYNMENEISFSSKQWSKSLPWDIQHKVNINNDIYFAAQNSLNSFHFCWKKIMNNLHNFIFHIWFAEHNGLSKVLYQQFFIVRVSSFRVLLLRRWERERVGTLAPPLALAPTSAPRLSVSPGLLPLRGHPLLAPPPGVRCER